MRFEYKYKLNFLEYSHVKKIISIYCYKDKYSVLRKDNNFRYYVRSLYFDSSFYNNYIEKIVGANDRIKFRIRTYDEVLDNAKYLNLEIKKRHGLLIFKEKEKISINDYLYFIENKRFKNIDSKIKEIFSYKFLTNEIKPLTIVDYFREAYFDKSISNVRISMDHEISYAKSTDIFYKTQNLIRDKENKIILEIKSNKNNIKWVTNMIKNLNLVSEKNSKYSNSFEHVIDDCWK